MKRYAWFAVGALVSLFAGMFLGLMLLAGKASQIFEGIHPSPTKQLWLQSLSLFLITLTILLTILAVRGVRRTKSER